MQHGSPRRWHGATALAMVLGLGGCAALAGSDGKTPPPTYVDSGVQRGAPPLDQGTHTFQSLSNPPTPPSDQRQPNWN